MDSVIRLLFFPFLTYFTKNGLLLIAVKCIGESWLTEFSKQWNWFSYFFDNLGILGYYICLAWKALNFSTVHDMWQKNCNINLKKCLS